MWVITHMLLCTVGVFERFSRDSVNFADYVAVEMRYTMYSQYKKTWL